MISCTIYGRGQAPKKVTDTDLSYLKIMDQGTTNVPYLLAQYLFTHAEGRKSGGRLSGKHFSGRLAAHFSLVSDEGLRVAPGPERQLAAAAARALEDVEGAHNEVEGDQAIMTPIHAPPPPPPALARTITQRLSMLEAEVHSLHDDMGEQRGVLDIMAL
ncbi:hypothetical protein Tco_1431541 [Tanacetum coccineum]